MGLYIAISFILSSFLITKFTTSNKSILNFNKIVFSMVLATNSLFYFFSESINLSQAAFSSILALFYIASITVNINIKKALESLGFALVILTAYLSGFNDTYILSLAGLIVILYIAFNQNINNIAYVSVCIFPAGILSIYLNQSNIFYIVSLMTVLGSIRYFVENKTNKSSSFFNNTIILLISTFIIQQDAVMIPQTLIALEFAFIFLTVSCLIQLISKNSNTIASRVSHKNKMKAPVYIKILFFNIYSISSLYAFKLGHISMTTSIIIIILPLILGYAKLWYSENENKFN